MKHLPFDTVKHFFVSQEDKREKWGELQRKVVKYTKIQAMIVQDTKIYIKLHRGELERTSDELKNGKYIDLYAKRKF